MSRATRHVPLALALALLPLHAAHAQSHGHHGAHGHDAHDVHDAREASQATPAASAREPVAGADAGHAGMDHAAMGHPATDHAAMGHAAMGHGPITRATGEEAARDASRPVTPIPPITEADRAAANRPLRHRMSHGGGIHQFHRIDRLEAREGGGLHWEAEGWIGTDTDRLWLRSEGERENGRTHAADLELLYGRSVSPWWDVVAGVRHDFEPGSGRSFAAIGVMGLAPQKFEVEATFYVAGDGQTALVLEAEREWLLTNRLVLQPVIEAGFHGKTERGRGIGAGLGGIEAGLRLRYEVTRRFAPYVGIVRERAFGETARLKRAHGEDADDTRVVAGVRFWF